MPSPWHKTECIITDPLHTSEVWSRTAWESSDGVRARTRSSLEHEAYYGEPRETFRQESAGPVTGRASLHCAQVQAKILRTGYHQEGFASNVPPAKFTCE